MVRYVWSYWEGPENEWVKKSRATWDKYIDPNKWEVRVLDKASTEDIPKPKNYDKLSPTMKSDYIRMYLLDKYGGVWIDASTELMENLDWIEHEWETKGSPLFFKLPEKKHPESWFIASDKPGQGVIGPWFEEFRKMVEDDVIDEKVPGCNFTNYFALYKAWCKLPSSEQNQFFVIDNARKHMHAAFRPPAKTKMMKYTAVSRTLADNNMLYPVPLIVIGVVALLLIIALVWWYRRKNRK